MKKIALITGGCGGLGYYLTKCHLEAGFRVFALDIKTDGEIMEIIDKYPSDVLTVMHCDIGSTESVNTAIDEVKKQVDHIDRLFNNAGIHRNMDLVPLEETDLDYITSMVNINSVGPMRVTKACLPLLHEGSVICYSSSSAGSISRCHVDVNYPYYMSKSALNMAARLTSHHLKDKGIKSLLIHPGKMKTNMGGNNPWCTDEVTEVAGNMKQMLDNTIWLGSELVFLDYRGNPIMW